MPRFLQRRSFVLAMGVASLGMWMFTALSPIGRTSSDDTYLNDADLASQVCDDEIAVDFFPAIFPLSTVVHEPSQRTEYHRFPPQEASRGAAPDRPILIRGPPPASAL